MAGRPSTGSVRIALAEGFTEREQLQGGRDRWGFPDTDWHSLVDEIAAQAINTILDDEDVSGLLVDPDRAIDRAIRTFFSDWPHRVPGLPGPRPS